MAAAADAADSTTKLDEVVVTARRVEENIQKVPVAVTALSPDMLRQKGIVQVTDLMLATPSLQMQTTYGRLSGQFSIRGISGGTQVYYAEVPGGPTEAGAPFYDIASVQVLNGPQGTLFGRANTAGAILVEPAKPRFNEYSGSAQLAGGNLGLVRGTAVLNVPVIDDMLAVRAAAHIEHLDGYEHEIGTSQRLSETNNQEARFSVNFKALDGRLTNYAAVDYYNVNEASSGATAAAVNTTLPILNLPASIDAPNGLTTGTATFGAVCNTAVAAGLSPNVNACIDQRLRIAATFKPLMLAEQARLAAGGHNAIRYTPADPTLDQRETLRKWTFVNQTAYDFGKVGFTTLSVRNIFGFQEAKGETGWDVDGLGGAIQSSISIFTAANLYAYSVAAQGSGSRGVLGTGPYVKTYTDEGSARGVIGDGLINWTFGGFYQDNTLPQSLGGIRNLSRVDSGVTLPTLGYNPSFAFTNGGKSTQKAVYGQATADLSRLAPFIDALHLTGGLRKSWDKSRVDTVGVTTVVATGRFVPTPGAPVLSSIADSSGYNSTLSLDAQVMPQLLVYGATRKGYRPGGVNTTLQSAGLPNYSPTYAPEIVRDYEIGAKWDIDLGAARARLNAAYYWTDYTNIQRTFNAAVAGVTTTYVVNASAAKIDGLELQGQIVWNAWSLSGTYSHSNARFTQWVGADPLSLIKPGNARCIPPSTASICLIDLSNSSFPNIPKNQGSITARYDVPMSDSLGQLSVEGTVFAQSRVYFSDAAQRNVEAFGAGVLGAVSQKAYDRINLRADWQHVRGSSFSVAAFVNNLTDVNYKTAAVTQLHSTGVGMVIYAEPRTVGVEARYEFGK